MSSILRYKDILLYIALWLIYVGQDAIWAEHGVIPQIIAGVILVWSTYHFCCVALFSNKPTSLKVLTLLIVTIVIYGLEAIINNRVLYVSFTGSVSMPFSYMKEAMLSIFPVFSFYYFGKKGKITNELLGQLVVVFFIVIIISYFAKEAKMIQLAMKRGSSANEFTNNIGYDFVYLIPYLYFLRSRRNAIVLLMAISMFLLLSMKRGAIFIGIVGILIYFKNTLSNAKPDRKAILIILLGVALMAIGFFAIRLYEQNVLFQTRFEKTLEGSTSGRDEIIDSLWSFFLDDASSLQVWFGSGANATLMHAANFAHNDWIEMLIDQGVIGLVILVAFYLSLYKDVRKMRNFNQVVYQSFRTVFIIVFVKAFFSMSICHMQPYETLLIGFYLYKLSEYTLDGRNEISFNLSDCSRL